MQLGRKPLLLIGLPLALTVSATASLSATTTTVLNVTSTVVAACTNLSTSPISFPPVASPIPADFDATGNIIITCTAGTPFTIALDGANRTPGTGINNMKDGVGSSLSYTIYAPGLVGIQPWYGIGNLPGMVSAVGTGGPQSFIPTGRITAGQSGMRVGAYSDTISVVITF
jgi:spore coat protein U-like protein